MGTGKRVCRSTSTPASTPRSFSFSHTNPYIGINNISRTYSLRYSDVDAVRVGLVRLLVQVYQLRAGVRLSDHRDAGPALRPQRHALGAAHDVQWQRQQAQNWVQQNGKPYSRSCRGRLGNIYEFFGSKFTAFELSAGWYRQSLNRGLFPDRGQRQSLSLSSSIPGTAVEYWVADYQFVQYVPDLAPLHRHAEPARRLWRVFGSTTALPPYRLFFGGGPDTVRGYRESRLGPKDNYRQPLRRQPAGGGPRRAHHSDARRSSSPAPGSACFYDMGNVFSTTMMTQFYGQGRADAGHLQVQVLITCAVRPACRWSGWHPWGCSGSAMPSR